MNSNAVARESTALVHVHMPITITDHWQLVSSGPLPHVARSSSEPTEYSLLLFSRTRRAQAFTNNSTAYSSGVSSVPGLEISRHIIYAGPAFDTRALPPVGITRTCEEGRDLASISIASEQTLTNA